jgi:hypothetical protein
MGLLRAPRSGSRAQGPARSAPEWEQEWREAAATEREESLQAVAHRRARRRPVFTVGGGAVLAALLPGIFPLTPGFSAADTVAAVVAAAVVAAVAIAIVPLAERFAQALPRSGAHDGIVFAVALCSAGAAAIHLAVAKMHFDEYTLFGVFFVGSGLAQLVWPLWLLLRRWRPLIMLGALGNGLIVALWAVDRIWGLPLGPEHWKPDPIGFGDGVTAAFEVLLVAGCVVLLRRGRGRPLRGSAAVALVLAAVVVTTLSLVSVLGVGSSFLTPTQ